ncbi:unnamed protein product [Diamesa tonsa]
MYEQSMTSANEILALTTGDKYINNNSINYTTGGTNSDIAFSKKAIHQCDADENLFLRFLELDPLFVENTTGTDTQSNNSASKKQQLPANKSGRTPFTITKKLLKSQDNGFGFSIVWTHPPRIEKVESQLSAEKSGILPGDYVIFIDKYNIVTMPELDILNLIRTQGNTLILEIFRRPTTKQMGNSKVNSTPRLITTAATNRQQSFEDEQHNLQSHSTLIKPSAPWSSSAMSNTSLETTKRRLRLPTSLTTQNQTPDSLRKRYLIQLINREQHFVSAINFGVERFVLQMKERKDLISANDHRTLYQNIDELLQLSEDILEQLLQNDHDPQIHFASRVYLSKTTAICAAYKKYCNGLKRADCVLVNKSRTSNSDFMTFINEPPIPKKRPDITTFIHRPLQHFREVLKLIQMIQTNCPNDSDESKNFTNVINELQAAYREITVGGGLMEPIGEGRPLLSLQDLESRLVFTKCKPFTLSIPGRQWIFGGDLSRIDGRSVKQFWTLLFSDIILFAKVSRDRVLFITDEPLPLSNVVDCCFNIRKKNTEFRLTIDPNGRTLESPTVHCTPDLTRTPLKSAKRRNIILRAPSTELKAVWQNLLTRQIFIMNTTLGSSLNSPLESPDIFNNNNNYNSSKINKKIDPEPKITKQLEELIDEKCNLLSKSGVSKEGTVHLAQWMKGQFNKQVCASEPIESDEDNSQMQDWSIEEVRKRSTELHLLHDTTTGAATTKPKQEDFLNLSEVEDELKSGASNTTSDSQITVRSSPINNNNSRSDSISVCRQCHKFCKKKRSSTPTQIKPVTSSLPTIAILPPTPDPIHSSFKQQYFNATKDLEITKVNSISIKTESSFDSIDEEDEEPPYIALKTSLRRSLKFGTMSSLERLPSEDTDEKTLNSSEEESDGDLKVVTREVYDNTQTFRTWTSRAGTFLEESRAFIDKYLGRTENGEPELNGKPGNEYDEYETIEGETSGATSGEEVWGTPTSGGENDEIHMFSNADGNRSSPTKSSSSYTGDEDTEIMMDELLMAPIMTSSNIRGLLPRRRLEPLFEEDTDSCDSNNESCLLTNDKQGERIGKSIERCQSLRTSIDSDSPKTTPSASLNGEQEEEQQQLNMMSPTTLLAQQDLLSPVEDLDLDEDVEVKHLESNESQKTTTPVEGTCGNVADKCSVSALLSMPERKSAPNHIDLFEVATAATAAHRQHQMRLSPRLEMRLALNHNIMGDEDLMMYEPGPNLTSILGRDLSTYHRVSGKDIIMNRIMNRKDGNGSSTNNLNLNNTTTSINNNSQTHELNSNNLNGKNDPLNSFYQQNNSKMDTPILNRKLSQRTWSSSGFARKEEKALSDLERLARREKIYCMTQQYQNSDSDSTISNQTVVPNKKNKLLRLLSRRNSESIFSKKNTKDTNYHSGDETASQHSDRTVTAASTKENDKTMYRRWTKQLSKRRRSTSLSENSS